MSLATELYMSLFPHLLFSPLRYSTNTAKPYIYGSYLLCLISSESSPLTLCSHNISFFYFQMPSSFLRVFILSVPTAWEALLRSSNEHLCFREACLDALCKKHSFSVNTLPSASCIFFIKLNTI